MESKIKIKEESVDCNQSHIENRLATSTNLGNLKNELEVDSAVKAEIKEEFFENDPRYTETQVSTDITALKIEPDDYNSDRKVKVEIKEEFIEDDQRYIIESQLSTSLDLEVLKEYTSGCPQEEKEMRTMESFPAHSSQQGKYTDRHKKFSQTNIEHLMIFPRRTVSKL
ncbi:uncharacterized protein LOC126881440 isoform X4 [Diabrotica virgifera virgifera]|uniref:Uncharacterized protein n=1 Tax=Diabrotica virgifera virgifera TaxID=50390 RepID=A0ABM5JUR9_DIAVI|nr:uncharacterized protein LOC126881440 isoform X4 [Diabrotica virgifera virgifera]